MRAGAIPAGARRAAGGRRDAPPTLSRNQQLAQNKYSPPIAALQKYNSRAAFFSFRPIFFPIIDHSGDLGAATI
jgi:hypothetical protein